MEDTFTKIVDRVFNNWTGLRLAVEHSLAGSDSIQVAKDIKEYMVKYCLYTSNIEVDDIQNALDDIMDEEFNMICEDNSTKDISMLLYKFLQLLKENNSAQLELEINSLPVANSEWLIKSPCPQVVSRHENLDDFEGHVGGSTEETPMEEDSEWTTVKSRKKR